MSDFQILDMRWHGDGFPVAKIKSNFSQQELELHLRWGSWLCSDPNARKIVPSREPTALLASSLCAHYDRNKNKLKPYRKASDNVFVKSGSKQKTNPFLAIKTEKENPFVKKAKINPFLKGKK